MLDEEQIIKLAALKLFVEYGKTTIPYFKLEGDIIAISNQLDYIPNNYCKDKDEILNKIALRCEELSKLSVKDAKVQFLEELRT